TKELDNNKGLNNKIKTAENDIQIVKNKVCNLNNRSNQIIAEAILGFTKTVNVKDKDIGQNKDKIVKYSIKIAQFLGLSKKQIESVKLAAVLYDLGKIGIDKNILLKESTLTEKEFNKIKEHPVIAVDIIKLISSFNDIIPIVLHHHERWDGCGYPSGLKGKEIPIGARILGIADSFQALISARPYRKAYTEDDAIKIIKDDVGLKFDSKIAKVFVSVLAKVQ
ncbi:MAG: HD domain-containing protein, partial [Candidatus Omnitrophica bacterium]|nr:HD domain-containing protein [Candidatus Omnitrophota bacterium]